MKTEGTMEFAYSNYNDIAPKREWQVFTVHAASGYAYDSEHKCLFKRPFTVDIGWFLGAPLSLCHVTPTTLPPPPPLHFRRRRQGAKQECVLYSRPVSEGGRRQWRVASVFELLKKSE